MPEAYPKDTPSRLVGDALIIAIITALGYLVTSIYESSYLGYFGIPLSPLSIPANEVIFVSCILFLAAIFSSLLSKPIYKWIAPKKENADNKIRHVWSLFFAYFVSFCLIRIFILQELSLVFVLKALATFIVYSIFILILGLIIKPSKDDLEPKTMHSLFLSSHLETFFGESISTAGFWLVLFLTVGFSVVLASDFGTSMAQNKNVFGVIDTNPPLVILAQYGNILLASPYDKNANQLIDQTYLININSLYGNNLSISQTVINYPNPGVVTIGPWERFANWLRTKL